MVSSEKKEVPGAAFKSNDPLAVRLDTLRQVMGSETIRVSLFVSKVDSVPSFRIGTVDTLEEFDVAPFEEDNSIAGPTGAGHRSTGSTLLVRIKNEDAERFRRSFDYRMD